MGMLDGAVAKIAEGRDLTAEEATQAMNEIMSGEAPDALIAGFLIGLRVKGETAEEIAACAGVLRSKAVTIRTKHRNVVDTCGTGGDGLGTFNISTTAAIIAAGAGVPVAKHGNRAVSSSCGSADVLAALGVKIDVAPEKASAILDEVGITFLFAPLMHSAMKHAAKVRKELGIRTIFNILGPLTNPAGSKRQVLGVFDGRIGQRMAQALHEIGSEHALVVHGEGGMDELSVLGKTSVWELRRGEIRQYSVDATDLGLRRASISELKGDSPDGNAEIVRSILSGRDGAPRDVALLNAAGAIFVSGMSDTLSEGLGEAKESVDSGRAKRKLNDWIESSQS
jgi:anthranilate phosphoribosyltransferase